MKKYALSPMAVSAAAAFCFWSGAAAAEMDAETRALIEDLKRRIQTLEQQGGAQKAPAPGAPIDRQTPAGSPAAAVPAAGANELKIGETKLTWGGYVKLDTLYSRFSEGEVPQSTGRDFYLPNSIPVSAGGGDSREFLDFHAKETRLLVKTETPLGEGRKIGTHIEVDFIVNQSQSANELVTNAYNPGFRRAFITYDRLLLGQEWTTFQNLSALPETLDFVAFPSEGSVFVRQPQIRYTAGGLMLALENPETSVLPNGGGAVSASNDNQLPDLIARYNFKFGSGHEVSLSGLLRELRVENAAMPAVKDDEVGGGLSLAGKFQIGQDDLKFMVSGGEGIGRYLALGTSADVVIDDSSDLEAIEVFAAYLAYKHQWTPKWRSTFTASMFSADNDVAFTGGGVTKDVQSFSGNLLYSPVARLTFGVEYRHAEREVESDADGDLDRVQASAKFTF